MPSVRKYENRIPPGYREMVEAFRLVEAYFDPDPHWFMRDALEPLYPIEHLAIQGPVGFVDRFLDSVGSTFRIELGKPAPLTFLSPVEPRAYVEQGTANIDSLIECARKFKELNSGDENMVKVAETVTAKAGDIALAFDRFAALLLPTSGAS
jgi:hypothetical protein